MRVAAYVPDLMDRSKVSAAVPGAVFVASPAALAGAAGEADVVVVDLARPGVLDVLASLAGVRVVAFASHVDRERIAAARAAGAEVHTRSAFFADVAAAVAAGPA